MYSLDQNLASAISIKRRPGCRDRASTLSEMNSMLKHARLRLYQHYLLPYQRRSRKRRSDLFSGIMNLRAGMRILDLGGAPMLWQFIDTPLNVTLLNLLHTPEAIADAKEMPQHTFSFEIGDACSTNLPSDSFDLVFRIALSSMSEIWNGARLSHNRSADSQRNIGFRHRRNTSRSRLIRECRFGGTIQNP